MFNFGSQITKDEIEKLKANEMKLMERYKKNLAQYKNTLADYKSTLEGYENRLNMNTNVCERVEIELKKMSLDFLHLKEQGNELAEDMDKVDFSKLDQLISGLDRLEDEIKNIKEVQVEMNQNIVQVEKRTNRLKSKINFVGFIAFLGTAAIIFMLLIQLEIIVL